MNNDKQKKEMTVSEAGRLGGTKRKDKIGSEGFKELGKKGGTKTKELYGSEYYEKIGRIGGETTKERHGLEHYEKMRELAVKARTEKLHEAVEDLKNFLNRYNSNEELETDEE